MNCAQSRLDPFLSAEIVVSALIANTDEKALPRLEFHHICSGNPDTPRSAAIVNLGLREVIGSAAADCINFPDGSFSSGSGLGEISSLPIGSLMASNELSFALWVFVRGVFGS